MERSVRFGGASTIPLIGTAKASMSPQPPTRLPNFLVIGAMKSGTTSLYHYLRAHPQIHMPVVKELNFFNPMRNWRRGVEWYEQQFVGASPETLAIGEASTSYTKYPWVSGVPGRIAKVLGDVRLIYVMRHPVERMRSHYLHNLVTGQEYRPIEQALLCEPMYLNISKYALQLEQYFEYFGEDQLLLIDSRNLRNDRECTLSSVFRFLGVDDRLSAGTIEDEFLRTADRRRKPAAIRGLRRIPKIRRMARYVPEPVKRVKGRIVERLSTKHLDVGTGDLSLELTDHLSHLLRDDVAKVRSLMGDGFDGWGIE